ncbi:MAG: dGTP triphosphohydrolase [Salibacteraceae bacterium]
MPTDPNHLFSSKRTGIDQAGSADPRTEFQRDFDRIIFSSSFRRLQNKTQVFPLPGSVFVHNRLTHSLEVASVGRSLGSLVGQTISERYSNDLSSDSKLFYEHNLYNVVASACLCHDIGNPAFGHSGEDAIASFFLKNESDYKPLMTPEQWGDLVNFEGNANAIRVLTQKQVGKSPGGLMLTYTTLAAIAKYPCESSGKNKQFTHRKKFGFFQSEKATFQDIAQSTHMGLDSQSPLVYRRHPFVWLVEAADDICYNIIDFEDAHRLGIVEHSQCIELLTSLIESISNSSSERMHTQLNKIDDRNAKVGYLRAKAIGTLTMRAKVHYTENLEAYLNGTATRPLFDWIIDESDALQKIIDFSIEHIYNHRNVIEIENAGYNVMYELLEHFIPPILEESDQRSKAEKKAIQLLPKAFNYDNHSPYQRMLGVLDYVAGMTDNYAIDLYKRIKGIEIGMKI